MSDNIKKPIRVLHVVGGMNRGGTETWLMHILRNTDREKFHMDFLVHTSERCDYDDEIRALGSKVIFCANPSRPLQYIRNLKRIKIYPYDVVHSLYIILADWYCMLPIWQGFPFVLPIAITIH